MIHRALSRLALGGWQGDVELDAVAEPLPQVLRVVDLRLHGVEGLHTPDGRVVAVVGDGVEADVLRVGAKATLQSVLSILQCCCLTSLPCISPLCIMSPVTRDIRGGSSLPGKYSGQKKEFICRRRQYLIQNASAPHADASSRQPQGAGPKREFLAEMLRPDAPDGSFTAESSEAAVHEASSGPEWAPFLCTCCTDVMTTLQCCSCCVALPAG